MLTFTQELHENTSKAIRGLPAGRTVAIEVQLLRAMLEAISPSSLVRESPGPAAPVPASMELRAAALAEPDDVAVDTDIG